MRLIDGDRLFAEIKERHDMFADCEYIGDKARRDELSAFMADIVNAPTIGGWISVKDRLPTSIVNKVLVWLEHEDLNGYIGFGHYEKYKGQEIWYDLEHNEAFSIRGYAVTHWMPMPEPPEEE